jgi:uncharacterized protein
MTNLPMMPKATAVWLVENTILTFDQVAGFCGLHPLEVQAIADGDVVAGMTGLDPVAHDQLTTEEIERCVKDPKARLKLSKSDIPLPVQRTKGARYTPVAKRQDKPDGVAWLLRTFPELSDAQIGKLLGTTKPTIVSIRERSHWNAPNIQPRDPVDLGLCGRAELDEAVQKARHREVRLAKKEGREPVLTPTPPPAAKTGPIILSAASQGESAPPAAGDAAVLEGVAPPAPKPKTADQSPPGMPPLAGAGADDGPDNPVLDPEAFFRKTQATPTDADPEQSE